MADPRPARQVVTAAPRRTGAGAAWPGRDDLYRRDEAAGLLLRSLLRAQLGVTMSVLVPAVVVIALYPLAAGAFPVVATWHVGPVPLTLLVLGGGVYPPLVGLGFWYVRRARRVEDRFTELLGES
ncbi:MAG TPA: hypothetical protein VKV25_04485 [Acidimicrobiales bacterium]|nr:hypothetical protein [Acidimicrobiales bacterium]